MAGGDRNREQREKVGSGHFYPTFRSLTVKIATCKLQRKLRIRLLDAV